MEMPDQTLKEEPQFVDQLRAHLRRLTFLVRNRRGKDRHRFYTDLSVVGECVLPCGCKVSRYKPERVRVFKDGELRHHGCKKYMLVPAGITGEIQSTILRSRPEEYRVPKNAKPPADIPKTVYAS
ncbi:hypothetical protein KGQ24_00670 [Patescibacteria group bacterium]|nr:hypothetical protein [Patescibacteria group bacterium]